MNNMVTICKSAVFVLVLLLASLALVSCQDTYAQQSNANAERAFSINVDRSGKLKVVGAPGTTVTTIPQSAMQAELKGVDVFDVKQIVILGVRKNPHYYLSCDSSGYCEKILLPH